MKLEQIMDRLPELIGGGAITTVSVLVGGWDTPLRVLLLLIFCDILSGLLKGWKDQTFSSRHFREGLMNKAGYFLVIVLAFQIDVLALQNQPLVRTACVLFYIGVEGVSLLENLGAVGVPIPSVIRKHLKALQDKGEDSETFKE